ncbi:uncharacterized protein LOC105281462 isoform X2 [Ooceraea biroi]|uniref:uncharacterized protein LOC105281462 isoform X2 n=1 Tax=Ooceraea biroi TaxID=2015173 RepID=UPI000F07607E|nr:uncharacterized protein LOC105281462 isoform X2 [Ooceraea biroi]
MYTCAYSFPLAYLMCFLSYSSDFSLGSLSFLSKVVLPPLTQHLHTAHDLTTLRYLERNRFPFSRMLPMPHNSLASYSSPAFLSPMSFDYRRETRRLSSETRPPRVFLLLAPLNVCGTREHRMAFISQIIAAGVSFDPARYRRLSPHLILPRDPPGQCTRVRRSAHAMCEHTNAIDMDWQRFSIPFGRNRSKREDLPTFGRPLNNLTVSVGREAIFTCIVEGLGPYKVAWLRVDTQTILTIANHVITKNHRIAVSHSGHRTWSLHIKDTRRNDSGWYMCQVNTDPMSSITGFLKVVVSSIEGPELEITRVTRVHMGPYLCIASNGVPPTVSKRIVLIVHFKPMVRIENQLMGAYEGQTLTLECDSEAFPPPITYWIRSWNETITNDENYKVDTFAKKKYEVTMRLIIKSVRALDFDSFRCVATNSLGQTDGKIKIYKLDDQPTTRKSGVRRDSKKKTDRNYEKKAAGMKDDPLLKGGDSGDELIEFQSATASSALHRHLFTNLGITAVILAVGLST